MNEPFPPFQAHSETSRAAARAVNDAPTQRERVYRKLRSADHGMTDEELQRALDMNPSTERPRRIELERAGRVIDSGELRKTRSGRHAVVWIAV